MRILVQCSAVSAVFGAAVLTAARPSVRRLGSAQFGLSILAAAVFLCSCSLPAVLVSDATWRHQRRRLLQPLPLIIISSFVHS